MVRDTAQERWVPGAGWHPDIQPWDPLLGTGWGRKGWEWHIGGEKAGVLVRRGFLSFTEHPRELPWFQALQVESSKVTQAGASFSQPKAHEMCRQRSGMLSGKAGLSRRKPLTSKRAYLSKHHWVPQLNWVAFRQISIFRALWAWNNWFKVPHLTPVMKKQA